MGQCWRCNGIGSYYPTCAFERLEETGHSCPSCPDIQVCDACSATGAEPAQEPAPNALTAARAEGYAGLMTTPGHTPRERPIPFSGPMVRAILEGRKTVTRRIARPGHKVCPYGVPGDGLWVKETHALFKESAQVGVAYAASCVAGEFDYVTPDGAVERRIVRRWRPSIFMPRWASRITLEVTDVRAERLHDITEEDAQREGVRPFFESFQGIGRDQRITSGELAADAEHRAAFAVLWDEINGDRVPWASNPWVWRVEFRRLS